MLLDLSLLQNCYFHLFILLLYSVSFSYQQFCNPQDQQSLLAFSDHLSVTSPSPLNWNHDSDCCSIWEGIDCNNKGRVTRLWLPLRGLKGTISSSLGSLTSLFQLNLSSNSLSGSLPNALFTSLKSLEIIDLSFNHLSGELLASFSSKGGFPSTIQVVDIADNQFSGHIESSWFILASNLMSFDACNNDFSGQIPASICDNCPLLRELDFSNNQFNGQIPAGLSKCSRLEVFRAGLNYPSGSLPASLMNCTNLVKLILRVNFLQGNISTLDFSRLSRLQVLDLGNNDFTGNIPESVFSCKSLIAIRVATNRLTGRISANVVSLTSLSFLSLSNNSFTNVSEAIKIFAACKSLTTLTLSKNFYDEVLPGEESFIKPDEFNSLQVLALGGCNFKGQVPPWLAHIKSLEILDLSYNQITGTIPDWFDTLLSLFYLDLSSNLLSGQLPLKLSRLSALRSKAVMDNISRKYLEIPLLVMPANSIIQDYNQLAHLPPAIYLGSNHLTGSIPSELSQLLNLHVLDLSQNHLSGIIPPELSRLTNIEMLDLSQNSLTGVIPVLLQNLNFLSKFNVSYNNLEGPIPTGGQFNTFTESSYVGNPGLCSEVLRVPCSLKSGPATQHQDTLSERIENNPFLHGFMMGILTIFPIVFVIKMIPQLRILYRYKS